MNFTTESWSNSARPTGWNVDNYIIICRICRKGQTHDCRLAVSVNFDLRHPDNRDHVEDCIKQAGFDTLGDIVDVSVELVR